MGHQLLNYVTDLKKNATGASSKSYPDGVSLRSSLRGETKMKDSRQLGTLLATVLVLTALMVFMSQALPTDEYRGLAGAEFLVS